MENKTIEQKEQWKQVVGFPRYQVSNQGRVKSFANPKNPKILRQHPNHGGYLTVSLVKGTERGVDGERKSKLVHQLVAQAFIENPNNRCHIDHINACKTDNRAENLRWCTPKENCNNPITRERMLKSTPERIKKISNMVLVYSDKDLTLLSAFTSTAEAARELGLSQGNISNVCMGSLPHYKHLIFSFNPINSQPDRDKMLEKGKDKARKRLDSVNKACQKIYHADIEKAREKGRKAYYRWKAKHGTKKTIQ